MNAVSSKLHNILNRHPLLSIFSVFLIIQVILFCKTGMVTGLEAEKYISEGNHFYETGEFTAPKYIFYLPVILLVSMCRWLGASLYLVVLVQVALSAVSLLCFYRLSKKIGGNSVGLYASILLALFVPLQIWNFFLYTDSIFISLTIIYSFIVFKFGQGGLKGSLVILFFLALLIFSRPHGMLFIPPTIIYFLFRTQSGIQRLGSIGLSLLLLIAMYFSLNAAFKGGGDMDAMKPFIEEHIICFVPLSPGGADLDITRTENPVNDLFYYIIHNPLHFLKFMGLKLLSFFNMTRSYYTPLHNLMLALFLVPLYFFSIIGVARLARTFRNFAFFLLSLLILYPIGATFQCDDWHSRFTMIVIPYFIILSCIGAGRIFKRQKL